MCQENHKSKISLNKVTHSVRASQSVLQYGVGAMVDFPDQTLMTAAPKYWEMQVEKIHDERLEKALNVDYFGMPGSKDEVKFKEGISYARFPEWYFCPKCRRFQPLSIWIKEYKDKNARTLERDPHMVSHVKCPRCYQQLVVARILTVCENGHIDDFPWVKWVHAQNMSGPKDVCSNPKLIFKTGASSAEGLEGLEVFCETCHAKATLRRAFDPDIFAELDKKLQGKYNFTCAGRHPWKHSKEACSCYPRAVQRGSSSVYFPVTESSLVIPPYSSLLTSKIESSQGFAECRTTLSTLGSMDGLSQEIRNTIISQAITQASTKISLELGAPEVQVLDVLQRKWQHNSVEEHSTISVKYRSEEYDALSGALSIEAEGFGDFVREATKISDYQIPYVRNISLIHKIREVQALIGFTRLKPLEKTDASAKQAHVVSINDESPNWYPAYQVRGEGIFIEFDCDAIRNWENTRSDIVQHRTAILNENYLKSFTGENHPRAISAKFVLLHTLSHLLIKQLSFECGYSIASIKERIYCSEASDGKEMAGILIYTASGDSEGTMGGLVRQGRSDTFPHIYRKAIENAIICSNDPVCSLSTGQGRDSLNMSACYSCALIPETSCEEFNVFLDRGLVVGTYQHKELGLYSSILQESQEWHTPIIDASVPKPLMPSMRTDVLLVILSGIDMRDTPYKDIWYDWKSRSDSQDEIDLFSKLFDRAGDFTIKEKPYSDGDFRTTHSEEPYSYDLIWKNSKVMLFSQESNDSYKCAQNSDWTCFTTSDPALSVELLLSMLKER